MGLSNCLNCWCSPCVCTKQPSTYYASLPTTELQSIAEAAMRACHARGIPLEPSESMKAEMDQRFKLNSWWGVFVRAKLKEAHLHQTSAEMRIQHYGADEFCSVMPLYAHHLLRPAKPAKRHKLTGAMFSALAHIACNLEWFRRHEGIVLDTNRLLASAKALEKKDLIEMTHRDGSWTARVTNAGWALVREDYLKAREAHDH